MTREQQMELNSGHGKASFPMTGRRPSVLSIFLLTCVLFVFVNESFSQVRLARSGSDYVLDNGGRSQRVSKTSADRKWTVSDLAGVSYEACSTTSICYRDSGGKWVCESYQSTDGVDREIVDGYRAALQYLADKYGAVVERDNVLNVEYISFPNVEDPYGFLLEVLLNDTLNGRPLFEYFKTLEPATLGAPYAEGGALRSGSRKTHVPNDPYFSAQWNLVDSKLLDAAATSFSSSLGRPVRLGLIDSGIDHRFDRHEGLDGLAGIHHQWIAQTTGFASSHALAIATLLGDAANDASGPVGLVGHWRNAQGVDDGTRLPVEIYSYNVGDFGPVSDLVARAVAKAILDEVDVINLSLRIAYSSVVERLINEAIDAGIVVVAAAGNYEPSHPTKPTGFPANMPGVIAVTGANQSRTTNQISAQSGYDLAAPGESIVVGGPDNSWYLGEGTSFAAPHVTATAALMKAANPDLTSYEVLNLLVNTGFTKGKGKGDIFLNAKGALDAAIASAAGKIGASYARGTTNSSTISTTLPETVVLEGNYPNPFNPTTAIAFSISAGSDVKVEVFDLTGRLIQEVFGGYLDEGFHAVRFDATGQPSGTYVYRVTDANTSHSGVMTLVK